MPEPVLSVDRPHHVRLALDIVGLAVRAGWSRGRHVTEAELVRELGVSRTPIRSALRLLAGKGIVEARRNQGFFLLRAQAELGTFGLQPAPSAAEQLYVTILRERMAGTLPRDVTQAELSSRYRAGRTSLEQALQRLMDDGLLRRHAGRRLAFVDSLTDAGSIRASYDLRRLIEPGLLRLQDYRVDAASLHSLRERHRDLLADLHDRRSDPAAGPLPPRTSIVSLDADFHLMLASFAENPFALTVLKQQLELRRVLEFGLNEDADQISLWCQEHGAILDAVLADKPDEAATLLEAHLRRAYRSALVSLCYREVQSNDRDARLSHGPF